jgi:hypothetical protein
MPPLNDPMGYEPVDDEWSPEKAVARAALYAGVAALLLGILLGMVAAWAPPIIVMAGLRVPIAFATAWLLAVIAERAAGMSGGPCTLIAVGLTAAILLSHHAILAVVGVSPVTLALESWWLFPMAIIEHIFGDAPGARMSGWRWFHPYVLLAANGPPAAAIALCVVLRRN